MPLNVVMLGPPGAGKGTQAERFAAERGVPKISTGDILREAVQGGTPLGLAAKATMEAGRLVSDDVMIGIVRDRLEKPDARRGFVLDGFPRTVAQADALDALMAGRGLLIVVDIDVPADELLRRLQTRLICSRCGFTAGPPPDEAPRVCARCGGTLVQRSDDGDATVRERLAVYLRDTRPLVEHYRRRPTFRSIDGKQPPERVAADLRQAVDGLAAGGSAAGSDAVGPR
jgi:adenylate kinase